MHSFILSNFSKKAAIEKVCEIAQITITFDNFFQHPDIVNLEPLVNEKTLLKKPSLKIEQIRVLKEEFNKKPLILPVQIAVLWQSQYLTISASNALLKLLEEPSSNSLIFLISDSYHHQLQTIQSRCQIIIATGSGQPATDNLPKIDLKSLYGGSTAMRMELIAQACTSQKEALEWLKAVMYTAREKLPKSTARGMKSLGQLIENCQIVYNDISVYNINYKLALDMLAMDWDKPISNNVLD